jgi:hypothetical protein
MSYVLALKRLDPFGRRDLGSCFACGETITWDDERLVEVTLRDRQPVPFHMSCFEHLRAGLNVFAEQILCGPDPTLKH